jgi:transketolase N-terminal domain/subunit
VAEGGSMHVADLDLGILGANGVVSRGIAIAAGTALAAQLRRTDQVAVSFMGDGATDIGAFHESLNLAAIWDVPVIFVVENNGHRPQCGANSDRSRFLAYVGVDEAGHPVREKSLSKVSSASRISTMDR